MTAAVLLIVWLAFVAVSVVIAFRPWLYCRAMSIILFAPFRWAGANPPMAADPFVSLVFRRRRLSDATPEEVGAWESRVRSMRVTGMAMLAVCGILFAWVLIAAIAS